LREIKQYQYEGAIMNMLDIIRKTIEDFCIEFVENPYLCYTEHGQHALFYTNLYNKLPEEQRYVTWNSKKVCVLQKEYPTAHDLDKSQRQHWDIAVLSDPPHSKSLKSNVEEYDYLTLTAAIEFGMNEEKTHLLEDIRRLCHDKANVMHGFIVHLYRLSDAGSKFSGRDWSPNSKQILTPEDVCKLSEQKSIEIFYGMADSTGKHKTGNGLWYIKGSNILKIK
jgi:hypothetical protein